MYRFSIDHINRVPLRNVARFFRFIPDFAFLAIFMRFPGLFASCGTNYHPGRKNVLNRRNAKNNLFWHELEKI